MRLSYQWRADGSAIPGASDASLRISPSLLGRRLSVEVTGTLDGVGSRSAVSEATAPVTPARISGVTRPETTGKPTVGRTLRARLGSWADGASQVRYQWLVDGKVLRGATKRSLRLRPGLLGERVSVRVTVVREGYETVTTVSRGRTVRRG